MIIDIPVVKHDKTYYSTNPDKVDKFILTYKYDHPTTLKRGYKQTPWKFTVEFFDDNHTHITGRAKTLKELKMLAYVYVNFVCNMEEAWRMYALHGDLDKDPSST